MAQLVKNPPAMPETACNAGDLGSVPRSGRPLEKGLATHSRVLAWEIPWTVEPGELSSMGSQRVRHDFVNKQQQHSFIYIFKIVAKYFVDGIDSEINKTDYHP